MHHQLATEGAAGGRADWPRLVSGAPPSRSPVSTVSRDALRGEALASRLLAVLALACDLARPVRPPAG